MRGALVEVWQANAAGRYRHEVDQHPAPLDPNFSGAGRCLTDAEGRYRFVTVKPGAYPWRNHRRTRGGRRTSTSRSSAALFTQRLVTQMYFPGDPLFPYDPIFNSVRDPRSRELLVARFDLDADAAGVGARVRVGHRARPRRQRHDAARGSVVRTPSQTVGPYYAIGLCRRAENELDPDGRRAVAGRSLDGARRPDRRRPRRALGSRRPPLGPVAAPTTAAASRSAIPRRRAASRGDGVRARAPPPPADARVPPRGRRRARRPTNRSLAEHEGDGLRFDIRMQGENATVFFAH